MIINVNTEVINLPSMYIFHSPVLPQNVQIPMLLTFKDEESPHSTNILTPILDPLPILMCPPDQLIQKGLNAEHFNLLISSVGRKISVIEDGCNESLFRFSMYVFVFE